MIALRLKLFFETNDEMTINCVINDEITNKSTIDEKLKSRNK